MLDAVATDVPATGARLVGLRADDRYDASKFRPSAPNLLALDDLGVVGDRITNVRQPRLTATAVAGLTVQLLNART